MRTPLTLTIRELLDAQNERNQQRKDRLFGGTQRDEAAKKEREGQEESDRRDRNKAANDELRDAFQRRRRR